MPDKPTETSDKPEAHPTGTKSDPTGTSTQAKTGPSATQPGDELSGDDLLAAAQVKAPHIDRAFLSKHGLDDDYLKALASGAEPPPPANGPERFCDRPALDAGRLAGHPRRRAARRRRKGPDPPWQLTPAFPARPALTVYRQ